MKKGLLLSLVLRIVMGTTVWAQETPSPEMAAFEKKIVEELPEWHFPSFAQALTQKSRYRKIKESNVLFRRRNLNEGF